MIIIKIIKYLSYIFWFLGILILILVIMDNKGILHFIPENINPYEQTTINQLNSYNRWIIFLNITSYILITVSTMIRIYIQFKTNTFEDIKYRKKSKILKYLISLLKISLIIFTFFIIVLSLFILLFAIINFDNIPK